MSLEVGGGGPARDGSSTSAMLMKGEQGYQLYPLAPRSDWPALGTLSIRFAEQVRVACLVNSFWSMASHARNALNICCSGHLITGWQSQNVCLPCHPFLPTLSPSPQALLLTISAVGVIQLLFGLLVTGRGLTRRCLGGLVGCSRPSSALILTIATSGTGIPLISSHYIEVCLFFGQLV